MLLFFFLIYLNESLCCTAQAGVSPHSAAWLWNQCSHVMSSLIIIMTSWKSDLPPAHSLPCRDWRLQYSSSALEATLGAEFDLSSLKTSLIRVGHSGTGHHRPRFTKKKKKGGGTNSSEITLSCVECAIKQGSRGSGCRSCACRRGWECCTESALRGPICSHFWAVLFAGFTDQSWIVFFFFVFFALTAGPLCAFSGEERQLSDIRLLFKVSVEERLFSHCMNASCGIFIIQWQTGSCSHIQ